MRIAICDDEREHIQAMVAQIEAYAGKCGRNFEVCTHLHADVFLSVIAREKFDAIFLDISMPEINGLDLAEQIRKVDRDVQIVFVTFMADQMVRGYDVMAAGFVCKPILEAEIFHVLNKVIFRYDRKNIPPYEVKLKGGQPGTLFLQDVLYLESRLRLMCAKYKTSEIEYWGKLSKELPKLDKYGFAQIHRSFLVNMAWVFFVSEKEVVLANDTSLQIGAKFSESFRNIYKKYKLGGMF